MTTTVDCSEDKPYHIISRAHCRIKFTLRFWVSKFVWFTLVDGFLLFFGSHYSLGCQYSLVHICSMGFKFLTTHSHILGFTYDLIHYAVWGYIHILIHTLDVGFSFDLIHISILGVIITMVHSFRLDFTVALIHTIAMGFISDLIHCTGYCCIGYLSLSISSNRRFFLALMNT